jgi:hypothetical protein
MLELSRNRGFDLSFDAFSSREPFHTLGSKTLGHLARSQVKVGAMMISKCAAYVFAALALAGCCASGTTCDAPAVGPHAAWDGLGPASDDNVKPSVAKPTKVSRPKDVSVRPIADVSGERMPQSKDEWERQQAADKADEARLSKKMIICRGCSAASSQGEDATGGVAR